MKPIKAKYANKMIDGKYYSTLKISGEKTESKKLTRAEFEAGEQGIVYLDNKTDKLVFEDDREKEE